MVAKQVSGEDKRYNLLIQTFLFSVLHSVPPGRARRIRTEKALRVERLWRRATIAHASRNEPRLKQSFLHIKANWGCVIPESVGGETGRSTAGGFQFCQEQKDV